MSSVAEPRAGCFIVVEGIDGSGSTTQAKRLVERLRHEGTEAMFTFEPSDGNVGQWIRAALEHRLVDAGGAPVTLDWRTLALLFAADRVDHVHQVIEPALSRGVVVVSDRYDLSSLTYQSVSAGAGSKALPWIRELNRYALRPDLTLVIDVEPRTAERRRRSRGAEAELFEVPELQRRLAAVYRSAESLVPGDAVLHIDGEMDVDAVGNAIWSAVQQRRRRLETRQP